MRTRTSEWFECKVAFDKVMENGTERRTKELYTLDALSFTEAEKRILEEMQAYVSGEIFVDDIKRASYKEIFFSDIDTDDRWYKIKCAFITLDETTGKEKRSNNYYLVQAANIDGAKKNFDSVMSSTMIDYAVLSVTETLTMDVFEYKTEQ